MGVWWCISFGCWLGWVSQRLSYSYYAASSLVTTTCVWISDTEPRLFIFSVCPVKWTIMASCAGRGAPLTYLWGNHSFASFTPALQHSHSPTWVVPHLQRQDGSAAKGLRLPDGVLRGVVGAAGARGQHDRREREHSAALQCVALKLRCGGAAAGHRSGTQPSTL